MMMKQLAAMLTVFALLAAFAPPALAQRGRGKSEETAVRSVQGVVTDAAGKPVAGAVVHLKNTRTLQIRSFIAKDDGTYAFHGLSTNVDYELKAEYQGASSDTKTLSVFDSRNQAVINLKLNK